MPLDMPLRDMTLWMLGITAGAGLVCRLLGRRVRELSALLALLAAAATLALAIGLLTKAPSAKLPTFALGDLSLAFGGQAALTLDARVTAFSGLVAAGAAFFALLTVVFSLRYARRQENAGAYYAYTLWALGGATLAALANNLLLLLIGWEIVTLMLYLLVGLGGAKARDGAAKTFVLLGFSDAALLLGIVLLAFLAGKPLRMDAYAGHSITLAWSSAACTAIFLLLVVGAVTKAGAMPLHTWIPAASEGAPLSVMAYLPAAVDKLLGIYLLAFVSLDMFAVEQNSAMQWVLLVIGAVTILAAVMMAMVQHDIRRLLSYHAVSQVGYMVLGIGTGTVVGIMGGLFHMMNHAIYKSCLFFSAGAVEDRTGETRVDRLGGLGGAMPVTFACMFVAAMAISGVPPLNGFVSKWMVYQGTIELGPRGIVLLVAAVFGSALTLASFVKVLHAIFFGPKPEGMKEEPAGPGGRFALAAPMVVLAVLCVALGLFAPLALQYAVAPATKSLSAVDALGEDARALASGDAALSLTRGLWTPGAATLLIALGVVLGLVVFFLGRGSRVRVAPPFLAAETIGGDASRYAATNFYKTVEELPILRTIYHDAEGGAYDVYYVSGRFGDTLVQLLRRAHNGLLPIYVGWCIIGLVIIVGYLLPKLRP